MKIADRIVAWMITYALWILFAFAFGVLLRPVFNAFMVGFNAWSD